MALADDFTVTVAGDIRHASGTTHYTVLELHRFLQALADDPEATVVTGDIVDITSGTPSERITDSIISLNSPYNIDDDASEYFYGGSITQESGDTVYSGLTVLGAVSNSSTQLMIVQDHIHYPYTTTPSVPFWGDQSTGGYNNNPATGSILRVLLKSRQNGCDIDGKKIKVTARHWGDSFDWFPVTLGTGEAVAAIGTTPDAQNTTTQGTVTAYTHVTNTEGFQQIDIGDGNGNQDYYSQWTYGADTANDQLKSVYEFVKDLLEEGSAKTIHGMDGEYFFGITQSIDYDTESGAFTEDENLVWGTGVTYDTLTGGTFTEGYYVTIGSSGAAGKVLFDDGVDRFVVALEDTSITLVDIDVITEYNPSTGVASGVTAAVDTTTPVTDNDKVGGIGVLLALDDTGAAAGTFHIQLIHGVKPVDGLEIYGVTSTQTANVNITVTDQTIPKIFLGTYTGTLIGAFGVGIDPGDLTSSDTVVDLDGDTNTPPNNVIYTVSGLVVGDYVLAAKKAGGDDFLWSEMTLATTISGAGITQIDVGVGNISVDAPATGTIRIELDDGRYRKQAYNSIDATRQYFNITSADYTDPDDAISGNTVMVTYLDLVCDETSEAVTFIYNASFTMFNRVRDGGGTPIKTYEGQGSVTAAGGSASATRIDDA